MTLVTTVNYRHKEIYYRYYKGPRYASETSYYKKFENEEPQDNVKSNKNLVKQFSWGAIFRGVFSVGQFSSGVYFRGAIFSGAFFRGTFFPGAFFQTLLL